MKLFQTLAPALATAERVTFTIEKKGNQIIAIVEPHLRAAPENMPENVAQVRAALAFPLRMTGSAQQLDEDFLPMLGQFNETRDVVAENLRSLESLKEAANKSSKAVNKARGKANASAGEESAEEEAGEEEEAGSEGVGSTVSGNVPPPGGSVVATKNPDNLLE